MITISNCVQTTAETETSVCVNHYRYNNEYNYSTLILIIILCVLWYQMSDLFSEVNESKEF